MLQDFDGELVSRPTTSQKDVVSYLQVEMRETVTKRTRSVIGSAMILPEGWDEKMSLLGKAQAAAGLFIWASTAIKMVENSNYPFDEVEWLVSNSRSLCDLDKLYEKTLRRSGINWESKISRDNFQKIVAVVPLSKIPLPGYIIDGILGFPTAKTSFLILQYLRSLMTYTEETPVSLLHGSFADYLSSPDHSDEPWAIDIAEAKRLIINRCFTVLKDLLLFNICDAKSSFVRNEDVRDCLSGSVRQKSDFLQAQVGLAM